MKRLLLALLLLLPTPLFAATGTVMPTPFQTVFDGSGNPISGGKVCSYVAGTTSAIQTYTDAGLSVANNAVITADSAGRFVAYLVPGVSYKFVYQSAAGTANTCDGATYRTVDNVLAVPNSASSVDTTGSVGEAITAGQCVYLSDGSGSKTQGQWYKCDTVNAYSSTLPFVGIAPTSIGSGSSGSIRLAGQVTGLSGLTIGGDYYAGAAGVLTATEPTLSRYLGRADTASSLQLAGNPRQKLSVNTGLMCGRLTLTTAVPITTSDVTAATTLFYTPMPGCSQVTLWNGSTTVTDTLAETSIAVPATTSQMYDVFALDTSGAVSIELLAWTNDTTRATAITLQNGFLSKAATPTRRYLGSFRTTTVSGQTEDSIAKRYVWNYYNRIERPLLVIDPTASWAYSTATIRQARATATNQLDVVVGVAEESVTVDILSMAADTTGGAWMVAIGLDSTTTIATGSTTAIGSFAANGSIQVTTAHGRILTGIGRHTLVWLEATSGATATTWYGKDKFFTGVSAGISGVIKG